MFERLPVCVVPLVFFFQKLAKPRTEAREVQKIAKAEAAAQAKQEKAAAREKLLEERKKAILYISYYKLYSIYYVLYGIHSILYIIYYVLCIMYYMIHMHTWKRCRPQNATCAHSFIRPVVFGGCYFG